MIYSSKVLVLDRERAEYCQGVCLFIDQALIFKNIFTGDMSHETIHDFLFILPLHGRISVIFYCDIEVITVSLLIP